MNKAMALVTSTLKTKTGGLLQEVKEAKKARVQSTNGLMAMLEQSRARLDNFT